MTNAARTRSGGTANGDDLDTTWAILEWLRHRVAGVVAHPSAHTTVRTGRYAAVHEELTRRRCSSSKFTRPISRSVRLGRAALIALPAAQPQGPFRPQIDPAQPRQLLGIGAVVRVALGNQTHAPRVGHDHFQARCL